ncbi:uncharacterized protein BX664DRAFT_343251 [Halteromyces radiatus]|uniref:uncharacterized protein n=1 Tax=Halteromyces radiatus TaxID=101107 RepID=UPI002220DEA0|nr:uncharacterized protein BX664DRAFT_343251 [Halteromyces radiatus]KAI8077695.1 hypothetical protein BX664DRAFT_343251 [Halteromyces radiatus]
MSYQTLFPHRMNQLPIDDVVCCQTTIPRSCLMNMLHDVHFLYPMECEHRPNILSRVLVCMYELQGDKTQATNAYQQLLSSLHFLRPVSTAIDIHVDNWEKHLGDTTCYKSYLYFFDKEIKQHGMVNTLYRYLNAMPLSIHAQLQPLVHLTFGLEHDLPLMVSEGLAYYASTLDYASPWILENTTTTQPPCSFDDILFDCIQSDPRFNGVMEGGRPLAAKIKLLLKNHGPLLQQYLSQWFNTSLDNEKRMDELMHTTLQLLKQHLLDEPTQQLLASLLAIRTLYDHQLLSSSHVFPWLQVQALLMMCTFIIQGRTRRNSSSSSDIQHPSSLQQDWHHCIQAFVTTTNPPPSSILLMRSLWKAQQYTDVPNLCLLIANDLVFSIQEVP